MANEHHLLRIGELSRRTGVSPEVLRAWERRYGLFSPQRTDGGFRLYSPADVARISAMKQLLAGGVSAHEAAQRITTQDAANSPGARPHFDGRLESLQFALLAFDEAAAQSAIDQLLMEFDAETVMRLAFLPVLSEIGTIWEAGQVSVAQEHFASNLIRRRLGGFTRGWEDGIGPKALLACPPEEEHDIPLLMFGIALGNRGWRITYLGPRTPVKDLLQAVSAVGPDLVVLASPREAAFVDLVKPLSRLARPVRIGIGGAGASPEIARKMGASLLEGDPITAADRVAANDAPTGRSS